MSNDFMILFKQSFTRLFGRFLLSSLPATAYTS